MANKEKPQEQEDVFADEKVTITFEGQFGGPYGKILLSRTVTNKTAEKIFKLIAKSKRVV